MAIIVILDLWGLVNHPDNFCREVQYCNITFKSNFPQQCSSPVQPKT